MTSTLRFAPSPTGRMHVGNLRAALLNFLYAKKNDAKFILRIDDTDQERSKQEYIDLILEDLNWLAISWDETFAQSERLKNYNDAVNKLEKLGLVYKCYETREELELKRKIQLSQKRPPVYDRASLKLTNDDHKKFTDQGIHGYWRFKLDHTPVTWHDMIHGDITIDTASISDPIVKKSDGNFVYILASVVDDIDSGITHIIRGDDHIANTAVQIQMFKALGYKTEIKFAHYPLLHSLDGDEFSKRNNSMSISWFREQGVEAMALNSILAKLGTSDSIEPCRSIHELVQSFDISRISKSRPKFDAHDVFRMNHKILSKLSYDDVSKRVSHKNFSEQVWEIIRSNTDKLSDIDTWCEIFTSPPNKYDITSEDADFLNICEATLKTICSYEDWIKQISEKTGRTKFDLYHPIRVALTGLTKGPELSGIFNILGVEEVRRRIIKCAQAIA